MLEGSKAYYNAAGIESPGGHQGWMGGTTRSDDDWMSTTMNLDFSQKLAKAQNCADASDLSCLRKLDISKLYRASKTCAGIAIHPAFSCAHD